MKTYRITKIPLGYRLNMFEAKGKLYATVITKRKVDLVRMGKKFLNTDLHDPRTT